MSQVEPSQPPRLPRWGKVLLGVLFISLGAIALAQLHVQDYLQQALLWVQALGPWGPVAFMALYILATVLFLPGSLLTLGGGVLFGLGWGTLWVFLAASIGATLAFLIGRYLARGWVAQKIEGNTKFQAIDRAIAREGLKIVLLTRLSPIFPFNLLNYALGVTQVRLQDYVLACFGMLPGTLMYVYIGSLAGNLASLGNSASPTPPQAQQLKLGLQILGLGATIAVTVYITQVARRALDHSVVDLHPAAGSPEVER